jgi:hypothetical protein
MKKVEIQYGVNSVNAQMTGLKTNESQRFVLCESKELQGQIRLEYEIVNQVSLP